MKRLSALLLALSFALAWGPKGHEIITQYAIWNLPQGPLKRAFSAWAPDLRRAANDPDRRKATTPGEAYRHYWSSELFEPWPFPDFPMGLAAARARFGEATLEKGGILPWAIEESYRALVAAFRSRDRRAIVRAAGDLAHYLGDAHQPFHTTLDFDGQSWLNGGIHALFESTLIDAYFDERAEYRPRPARVATEGPLALAFAVIRQDYPLVRALNQELWKAKRLYSAFDRRYYRMLWTGVFGKTERVQIRRAGGRLSSLYLTAWIEAGQPELGAPAALRRGLGAAPGLLRGGGRRAPFN